MNIRGSVAEKKPHCVYASWVSGGIGAGPRGGVNKNLSRVWLGDQLVLGIGTFISQISAHLNHEFSSEILETRPFYDL